MNTCKIFVTFMCSIVSLGLADFTILSPGQKTPIPPGMGRMLAQWADGDFGQAVYCSPENGDQIVISDCEALHVGTGSFTLSAWICPETLEPVPGGTYRRLFEKNTWPKEFWVLDIHPDGRLMLTMKDHNQTIVSGLSKAAVTVKAWNHVVIAVDRENFVMNHYINGRLVDVTPFSHDFKGSLDIAGAPLQISSYHKFIGLVGEVSLRRGLLSAEQVQAAYDQHRKIYVSTNCTLHPKEVKYFNIVHPSEKPPVAWNPMIFTTPNMYPVEQEPFNGMKQDAVRPLMFDSVPYEGKPTRVFAWYGAPAGASAANKVPAMVLVHGGGGTAFRKWVKIWNDRGYAAIAMDNCGHLPLPLDTDAKPWPKHEWSGPAGWGDFGNMGKPMTDHWAYHAVAAVVRAHSLIRSFPEVDASRIGLTGISWGGYLTNMVAGVDSRFRFAAPVYGCGFLGEGSSWTATLRTMNPEHADKWLQLWDPAQYLSSVTMPMLFCNGTHDAHYWPFSWMRTTTLPKGDVYRSYKIKMPHGHAPSGDPPEILVFADAILKQGRQLPRLVECKLNGTNLQATAVGTTVKAELVWSPNPQDFHAKRVWTAVPAKINGSLVSAQIPADAKAAYLAITDDRSLYATSAVIAIGK